MQTKIIRPSPPVPFVYYPLIWHGGWQGRWKITSDTLTLFRQTALWPRQCYMHCNWKLAGNQLMVGQCVCTTLPQSPPPPTINRFTWPVTVKTPLAERDVYESNIGTKCISCELTNNLPAKLTDVLPSSVCFLSLLVTLQSKTNKRTTAPTAAVTAIAGIEESCEISAIAELSTVRNSLILLFDKENVRGLTKKSIEHKN